MLARRNMKLSRDTVKIHEYNRVMPVRINR